MKLLPPGMPGWVLQLRVVHLALRSLSNTAYHFYSVRVGNRSFDHRGCSWPMLRRPGSGAPCGCHLSSAAPSGVPLSPPRADEAQEPQEPKNRK